jgi:hypothetical protein
MNNKQVAILVILVVVVLVAVCILAAPALMDAMRSSVHVRPPH